MDVKIYNPIVKINISVFSAHLQSSVFKLSKDLIDSIHEEDKDKVLSNDAREQNIGVYSSLSILPPI